MHGKDEKCIQNFGLEVLKERDEGLNRKNYYKRSYRNRM
jgi:hypothetical protein